MTRYASKNLKDLKVGISGFSDNKTSLVVEGSALFLKNINVSRQVEGYNGVFEEGINTGGISTIYGLDVNGDLTTSGDIAVFNSFVFCNNGIEVSGIITSPSSGIVTYFGDGSGLTNLNKTSKSVVKFIATAGQTTFTTPYDVGFVDVYLNGVKLTSDLYTSTSGTSIILNDGAALNDIIEIISFSFLQGQSVGISNIVQDGTPQLGGDLNLNNRSITGTGNINITGNVTATNANFSGNVSIGGTLIYEDVTNIDSIGIITARSGINVTGIVTATSFSGDGSNLTGVLSDIVEDNTPQLGGDLDTNGAEIISVNNLDISLKPNGSGAVVFKGVSNNGGNGAGRFKLNCEQNSHGITIQGPPHSANANYTLTLPDDDGNADQVLKTDGSGVLSWVDQTGGGGGSGGVTTGKAIAMAMIFG